MEEIIQDLIMQRRRKHVSISELARRIGTNHARISEMESGKGGLTLKRLIQYADALGLKVIIKYEEK